MIETTDKKIKEDIGIVYLAAGVSSRFNYNPKSLQEVGINNKTFLECSLDQVLKSGFNKIFIIVGDKTESLFKDKFGDSYKEIPIIYTKQLYDPIQRSKPWGQIDALSTLKGKIDCPFVVCNGDDLYGEKSFKILYNHLLSNSKLQDKEAAAVWYPLGDVLPEDGAVNRGIFEEEKGYAKKIRETSSISRSNLKNNGLSLEDKCSMGIFALDPQMINDLNNLFLKFKEENKGDKEKEYPFGTGLSTLIKKNGLRMKLYPSNSKWAGLTRPADLVSIQKYLKENNSR